MPIMEISIIPLGTQTPSISKYIACCLGILKKEKGITFEFTSMGTIVEASSLRKLFGIAEKMHKKVLSCGIMRVTTTIKIDERLDKRQTMKDKIKSVKQKLTF